MPRFTEHALQAALAKHMTALLPPHLRATTWWSSIDHAAAASAATGASRKARGVQPGIPDLLFLAPGLPPLFVELKTGRGRLSATQLSTIAALRAAGAVVAVARSASEMQVRLSAWAAGMTSATWTEQE